MENVDVILPNDAVKDGKVEVILREGQALEAREQRSVDIEGIIDSPATYLAINKDEIEKTDSYLLVNEEKGTVSFFIKKHDHYQDKIVGKLKDGTFINNLPINTEKALSPKELGKLLKRNVFIAADRDNMNKLIGRLLGFQAKIDTTIADEQSQSGDTKKLLEKKVESNIPESFTIKTEIYRGAGEVEIKVDIYAEATSAGVEFLLESVQLIQLKITQAEELIGKAVEPFSEFGCPIINQ